LPTQTTCSTIFSTEGLSTFGIADCAALPSPINAVANAALRNTLRICMSSSQIAPSTYLDAQDGRFVALAA
jgi:hypothetical protein